VSFFLGRHPPAGAALRILRSRLTRAGSPNTEASCLHEKHDIVSFFLGKRSLLVLRFASCEAVIDEGRLPEHRSKLTSRKTRHRVVFSWPASAG
jgi:hypothetical protein